MIEEIWKPIPGYTGAYEVSTNGGVRSLDRVTDRGRRWRGKAMTPSTMPSGYKTVSLWREGKQKTALVHRLVLFAFVGPAPDEAEVRHKDGNPSNNTVENLAWGTHAENQLDQVAHGTHPNSSKECCPAGHPYDPVNTYIYPGKPHRACRICRAENLRLWNERNPERAKEIRQRASARYEAKRRQKEAA